MKKRPLLRSFNFVLLSVCGVLSLNVRGGRFADCKRDAGLCDPAFLHVRRAFVEHCAETVGTGQVSEHVDGVSCTQREITDIQRTAKRSFVIDLDRVDVLKLRVENLNRYDIFLYINLCVVTTSNVDAYRTALSHRQKTTTTAHTI